MKFMRNVKYILNEILVTFEKNVENFWKNFGLIISEISFNFEIIY